MDDDVEQIKDKKRIIEKCIDQSYQIRNKLSVSTISWKSKFLNIKDLFKYNLVNLNTKFYPESSPIHILYKIYNPEVPKGLKSYQNQLNKLLIITYRSNYKEQINIKNNSTYTSDCGWGCMIRSSQMIISRMIYKIFKQIYKNRFHSDIVIKSIIPFFLDNNITMTEINIKSSDCINIGLESYINQLNKFLDKKIIENQYKQLYIKSIDPPFSIQKICIIGEIYGRTCGEWFSDYELPKIYDIINETFNIIPNLSILHFNSDVEMNLVIDKCFEKIENREEIPILEEKNYFKNEKNELFKFKKMGAIFISVRLGVSDIPPEYFPSIKKLFECKQFLGIIGGKVNSASYFFGYCDDDLLYLDPHFNQESINDLDEKNLMTYIFKVVYKLPLESFQPAFTVGFLFRNLIEFRNLYVFMKSFILDKLPCFHVHFNPYKEIDKLTEKKINNYINNEDDDF
jgi:cysteine protease ATG4